jgi:hypothetical protein
MPDLQIYANEAYANDGAPVALLVITSDLLSLNIWLQRDEIDLLHSVRDANWENRQTLQIGTSAGTTAFWSADATTVSILIGHDDETWDFGVMIPIGDLERILDVVNPLKTWLSTTSRIPPTKYRTNLKPEDTQQ